MLETTTIAALTLDSINVLHSGAMWLGREVTEGEGGRFSNWLRLCGFDFVRTFAFKPALPATSPASLLANVIWPFSSQLPLAVPR